MSKVGWLCRAYKLEVRTIFEIISSLCTDSKHWTGNISNMWTLFTCSSESPLLVGANFFSTLIQFLSTRAPLLYFFGELRSTIVPPPSVVDSQDKLHPSTLLVILNEQLKCKYSFSKIYIISISMQMCNHTSFTRVSEWVLIFTFERNILGGKFFMSVDVSSPLSSSVIF